MSVPVLAVLLAFICPCVTRPFSLTWQRSPSQTDIEILQADNEEGEGKGLSLWWTENNAAGKPELGFRPPSGHCSAKARPMALTLCRASLAQAYSIFLVFRILVKYRDSRVTTWLCLLLAV